LHRPDAISKTRGAVSAFLRGHATAQALDAASSLAAYLLYIEKYLTL
jgi:hypothetical protein